MLRARVLFALVLAWLPTVLATAQTVVVEESTPEAELATIGYGDAIILGLVEGITEFLPVSSTGHLVLANAWLGLDAEAPLFDSEGNELHNKDGSPYTLKQAADAYAVIIQGGAILAVLLLYRKRVFSVIAGFLGQDPAGLRLGRNLILAFIPAAILGVLLDDLIESYLFSPVPIAIALAAGAILMLWVERWRKRRPGSLRTQGPDLTDLSPAACLKIGLLQTVAMWPGTSRSMMTLVGGYLAGLNPVRSAEFSFLLGLVTLGAASGYKLVKSGPLLFQGLQTGPLLVGGLVAALSAAIAVKALIHWLTRHGLAPFAWYRLVLAVAVLLWWS